ncbi:thymidine phosphorylase-like isoform X2 [Ptychodera flava]|uniref:thymidine phosphorylase-like isoform X2 n=1 Tax=Ptychodera flava TaxID=63121 RepID=UPI00396A2FF4
MSTGGFLAADLIAKKRDGQELNDAEIGWFIDGVVKSHVEPSQLGSMLMAIYLKGMSTEETTSLTKHMMNSGDVLQWPSEWKGLIVDKHSTGGVGDKISLPLAPALAACSMKVPMISGRGLGFTGGTLDKLEAIPGFTVNCSKERMQDILEKVGCFIVGQTAGLVPADKTMYATRDISGTVESIPLISSSIICKKAAESLSALVLDVKCGKAAFMKTEKEARLLAESLVKSSNGLGIKTVALLTQMDSPIGYAIGNALEVAEAVECLHGGGPADLAELVSKLGGHLLYAAGHATTAEDGISKINEVLKNGRAMNKFKEMMVAQGVEEDVARKLCSKDEGPWSVMRKAPYQTEIKCNKTGIVESINALELAKVSLELGAGRAKASDKINFSVGLQLKCYVGKKINDNDVWLIVHHDSTPLSALHQERLQSAIQISDKESNGIGSRVIDVITY